MALACGKSSVLDGLPTEAAAAGSSPTEAPGGQGPGGTSADVTAGAGGGVGGGAAGGGAGGLAGASNRPLPTFNNFAVTGSWPTRPITRQQEPGSLSYGKMVVHDRYLAESCAIGDYNLDGKPDVSSGRRWYEGPTFNVEHIFRGGHDDLPRTGQGPELVTGVSDDAADYAYDMDSDGDPDIINVANVYGDDTMKPNPAPAPQPARSAYWYENPGPELVGSAQAWTAHLMTKDVAAEHHGLGDVDGDGRPELYAACSSCNPNETLGFYRGDWAMPTKEWAFKSVSGRVEFPFGGTGKLHGLGFGDVNLDGQPDLIERAGVWVDILSATSNQKPCPELGCGFMPVRLYGSNYDAGQLGGAHMFSFDVDGDGDGDVVSADLAHGYGVSWYEQTEPAKFVKHLIVGSPGDMGIAGIVFSQPHALEVADMDGDGVPDLITGKSRFANPDGYGDPDLNGAPVVYVLRTVRNQPNAYDNSSVSFEPYLVDMESGIGKQIAVGHVNDDGILDLCVASKLGLSLYLGE